MPERCDIAIIGAGPYGLSAAAHLRTIKGLDVRIFGQPMSFWDRNMPAGMLLRSNWSATQIADPFGFLTLEAFKVFNGNCFSAPVPVEEFVQYGLWYQQQAVPHLDRRLVRRVDARGAQGFRLRLEDGHEINCQRVIVAAGIGTFAWWPEVFREIPWPLVSHSSEHRDFHAFSGKSVLVIGGGQSALESAALLYEAGADVEVVTRAQQIHWLDGFASRVLHQKLGKATRDLLYAPTDVGPAGLSQLMARPDLLQRVPREIRDTLHKRSVRPASARWLKQRLRNVPLQLGRSPISAVSGSQVRVRLSDGSARTADHVLLGTGYRVDISKYGFLAPELILSLKRVGGYPVLGPGFETSVAGLHMLGAPAAWNYGPLMQSVSGTGYASRALLGAVGRKSTEPVIEQALAMTERKG